MQNLLGTFEKRGSPKLLWNSENGSWKPFQASRNKHTAMKQSQQCNIISKRLEQQVKKTEAMVKLLIIWSPRRFSRWSLLPVKSGGLRKTNPAHIKNSGLSFVCTFTSLTSFLCYVPVNSKTAHAPPPPPGQTSGHLTFLKNFGQIPRYVASLDGQMPHPLELQRGSNPPTLQAC